MWKYNKYSPFPKFCFKSYSYLLQLFILTCSGVNTVKWINLKSLWHSLIFISQYSKYQYAMTHKQSSLNTSVIFKRQESWVYQVWEPILYSIW